MIDILSWCLLALALACIITFAAAVHEEITTRSRRKQLPKPAGKIPPHPIPGLKPDQSALNKAVVRGYDSQDLFREDLWLLRIAKARQEMLEIEASMASLALPNEYQKRVCATLAYHAGTHCGN